MNLNTILFSGSLVSSHVYKQTVCSASTKNADTKPRKAKTPVGKLDDSWEGDRQNAVPAGNNKDAYAPFPDNKNPETGELGGPRGPEPTRYGDWERKGRVIDF